MLNDFFRLEDIAQYLRNGGWMMAVISLCALLVYGLLAERTLVYRNLLAVSWRGNDHHWVVLMHGERIACIRALIVALPLLGLLGTVSGMMDAFAGMRGNGQGAQTTMTVGISQALVTTQYALALVVPALLWEQKVQTLLAAIERMHLTIHNGIDKPAQETQHA